MGIRNGKAPQVIPKTQSLDFPKGKTVEAFGKTETFDLPKMEELEPFGKAEQLDFPKKEKLEPFGKTEQLDFRNIEKLEPFGKTEPLDFPKKEKLEPFGKTEPLDVPEIKSLKLFGQTLFRSKSEEQTHLLLCLSRIRDFIMLLLNYPVRTIHDSKLKPWIHQVSNKKYFLRDVPFLLNEKPLKCLEGLLPIQILEDVEAGGSSMLADKYVIPKRILNLAANLAVCQLLQTVLSKDDHAHNIHHVMLSTRDEAEKRLVAETIKAALKAEDNMIRLHESFRGVLSIDASVYQRQVEAHVRQQVAQQLQLPLMVQGDDLEGNDNWLITGIEKEMSGNKYLVLLVDGDAEEPLDPRKVGFPEKEIAGVGVLITTESSKQANDELTMAMDLNIGTRDHLLPWEVFCQTIGNELIRDSSNAIHTIAVRIVEECGGHLLAINIVAKSLKNEIRGIPWENALDKLRWLHPSYDISLFHGQSRVMVNAFINFIWHDISKTQKQCLACCLFIPNIKDGKLENELKNDWISSGLVDAGEAEHNLRELVDRFVLLQFKDTKLRYIQMPADTYAILQSLNTQNPLLMKKAGLGLIEAPSSELWPSAVHIELQDNKLSELPSSPICFELTVLMLHNNADLTKIPTNFFIKMPLLCILDLSYTSIRELPSSFYELERLRELYMKGCERFMKLPPEIGKLKKLEKLDLDKTQIMHMPEEIQELTNLQSLTLCFYEYRGKKSKQYASSTIVPYGVISKLRGLKHLCLDVNPDDERWYVNTPIILPEIAVLEYLQTISLYIPLPELVIFLPARILEHDFRFVVGQHMSRIISGTPPNAEERFKQSECSLKFVKGVDVPGEIKRVVRHSKALFLDQHMTIKDLSEFGMNNLEQLQVCILAECKEMQTILDGRHSSSKDAFSRLLLLSVSYMKNLRSISERPVRSRCCFGMLKSLTLHNCPKLTTIFTLDFLDNLSLLKVLTVKDCPKISTLITRGSFKLKGVTFLPKLRTISLLHLPGLITISNGLHMGASLESIGIYDCPKLQRLSKKELSSKYLKVIKGETKWWEALKWSKEEWGEAGRPSKFDYIFSPINNQVDIMSQVAVDDDIDDCPADEPWKPSSKKVFKDKKQNANTRRDTTLTVGPLDDGHSWRKYGQKFVVGVNYPKIYYKCAETGCKARKQEQMIEEERAIYLTTYDGHHTCKNLLKPDINSNFASPSESSTCTFENTLPREQDRH